MAQRTKQTTSLWAVIEGMQRRLEAEGLDKDVVDSAVSQGLQALLDITPPKRRRRPLPRWLVGQSALAKA